MKRFTWFSLFAAMFLLAAGPVWGDSLLYFQNPDYNGAYASQNDTTGGNGNFATAYDNFTLGSNATIDEVQWIGSYFNPPTQGPITGFTIGFYASSAGAPGTQLFSEFISGNAGETFLQNDNAGDPTYLYGDSINPFAVTGGTEYWLSIVPDLGFPPQWGWETGTGGDGSAYQCFLGTCGSISGDLSFALDGTVGSQTPEPGSLMLLGTGLIGVAGFFRRRLGL